MKANLWSHYGTISVRKIREKTGADKVLVPVNSRKNIPGTFLIAFGTKLVNSDGHVIDTEIEGIMPTWKFVNEENQKHATILPRYLSLIERQKKSIYRIVQLDQTFLWIETRSQFHKVGKPFTPNEFLLTFKES